MTEHTVSIVHDERYLARPYGAVCSCGWIAACVTELEAYESKKIHLERAQHETAKGSELPAV